MKEDSATIEHEPLDPSVQQICGYIENGMTIARVNVSASHGDHDSNAATVANLNEAMKTSGKEVGILLDTSSSHEICTAPDEIRAFLNEIGAVGFGSDWSVVSCACYVRSAADVYTIRYRVRELLGGDYPFAGKDILIISKIECANGLENFDEILQASDGIMVTKDLLDDYIQKCNETHKGHDKIDHCENIHHWAVGKPIIITTNYFGMESVADLGTTSLKEYNDEWLARRRHPDYRFSFLGAGAAQLAYDPSTAKHGKAIQYPWV